MIQFFEREPGLSWDQAHIQKAEDVGSTHPQQLGLCPLQPCSLRRPEYAPKLTAAFRAGPAREKVRIVVNAERV